LRWNAPDDPELSRTPGSAGSQTIFTLSTWFKRSELGTAQRIAEVYVDANNFSWLAFDTGDKLSFAGYSSGYDYDYKTTQVFRDVGAWMHLVVRVDTTDGTAGDRIKIYINGAEVTAFSTETDPSSSFATDWNTTNEMTIGCRSTSAASGDDRDHFEGYMAEFYWIDGTAYDADDFGETSSTTNQWIPLDSDDVKDAVTFGTNGFYLDFADSADLGDDESGEGNDFTATNLVATDQMVDTPTNNFCTFNPLLKSYLATTFTEGNLVCRAGSGWNAVPATFAIPTGAGKWYWEYAQSTSNARYYVVGNNSSEFFTDGSVPQQGDSAIGFLSDGNKAIDNTETSYGTSWASDASTVIISCALNLDDDEITWYRAGVSQGAISFSGNIVNADFVVPFAVGAWYGDSNSWANFGADSSFAGRETAQGNQDSNGKGDFYYTPPSGFLALCTDNLSAPEIALPGENFNTIIWTGDSGGRAFTGVGFQPDFVWAKNRDDTWGFTLVDSVRGGNEVLTSDTYDAEVTNNNNGWIDSFDSDGFTVIAGASNANWWNNSGDDYVGWNWKAGGTAASNTDGSITSSVSANTTAGFSIASYTGTGSAATIGHGLSSAPELILVKNRDAADDWQVYCASNTAAPETDFLVLNTSAATVDSVDRWNDTPPSASVFTVGDSVKVNTDDEDYIAYCFHSVEGYSKVGSYEGNNNADGSFIYLGFRPAFLLLKSIDGSAHWEMEDDKRDTYNLSHKSLQANLNYAEDTSTSRNGLDFVSNGFKFRSNSSNVMNGSETYLYIAFAESPFKYSNAR
jgi:hypothetical protein